ncbi:MAG: glycosyltransferase [Phycisphaerales bacterium]
MIDAASQPGPSTPPTAGPAPAAPLRVALAHDWLVALRGGELVLDAIARLLTRDHHTISRIYTMFDAAAPITPAIDSIARTTSPLNRTPPALRRWLLMRYPAAMAHLGRELARDHAREPVDLLISTHSAAIKALKPPMGPDSRPVPHLCYCHSPARYLWSQTDAYAAGGPKGRLRSLGLRAWGPSLRRWDRATADHVTRFIANSTHTADQIRRHYDRDSTVVHPPVRTDFYTPDGTTRDGTLLLVSALEPYKCVELAIEAACIARRPLTIVGSGSHERGLRAHARLAQSRHGLSGHITFTGRIDDNRLLAHYRAAGAFLFPQIEDFGITAVEAQAAGCPVVARRAGGALDTVVDAETGAFFDEPDPEACAEAIGRCPTAPGTEKACRSNALRFAEDVFSESMRRVIAQTVETGG